MAEESRPIRAHIEYMTNAADRLSYEQAKNEFLKQNEADTATEKTEAQTTDNNAAKPAENPAVTPAEKAAEVAADNAAKPADKPEQPEPLSDRVVMEHTAGIWQYKPIADTTVELHEESHAKYLNDGAFEIIAARARGKKHKHDATNCDDWFETAVTNGCAIAVVADGAGSKKFSRIGARIVCETAVEYLRSEVKKAFEGDEQIKSALSADFNSQEFIAACTKLATAAKDSAKAAYSMVIEEHQRVYNIDEYANSLGRKPEINDFYSTFLAAVIVPLGKECFTVTVQIGDGCICGIDSAKDADACLKLLGEPDSGSFSGETEFISEKNVDDRIIAGKTRISRGTSDTFLLMSDGVADDYYPSAPMMKRLYLDLALNGILPMQGEPQKPVDPAPVRFRSVSERAYSVELQYAKQLLSADTDIDALWNKRDKLRCHSLEAFGVTLGETPQERLLCWIDNYNERGSFDDRTLAIIRVKNGGADA